MKKVSIVVSTYGRAWLLEEMIQSFIYQDYKYSKELIIINDATDVKMYIDHPEITIVNMNKEAKRNPYKRDIGVSMATGDLCFTYDDDDLMLPHRISSQVKMFDENPKLEYLQNNVAYLMNNNKITDICFNFFFNGHMWKTDKYITAVSEDPSEYDDIVAYRNLQKSCIEKYIINEQNYINNDIGHIYRWSGVAHHHSGFGLNAIECEEKFKKATRSNKRFKTGKIELFPHFKHAYYQEVERFLKKDKK